MNRIVLIFFFINSFFHFGQEHGSLFKPSELAKNRVYKVYEYDALDSMSFVSNYPNGYYSIYDENGQIIKSNFYLNSYDVDGKEVFDEYISYYLYDSDGNEIGFFQMNPNEDEPFRMIVIQSFNSETNMHKSACLTKDENFINKFEFNENPVYEKRQVFSDTISIDKYHKRAHLYTDTSVFEDIYFSKKGIIDSTILHNSCLGKTGKSRCWMKTINHYDQGLKLTAKYIFYFSDRTNTNPNSWRKIKFDQYGFVESIESYNSQTKTTEIMKYVLYYRED